MQDNELLNFSLREKKVGCVLRNAPLTATESHPYLKFGNFKIASDKKRTALAGLTTYKNES
jgi:hypothetical protein